MGSPAVTGARTESDRADLMVRVLGRRSARPVMRPARRVDSRASDRRVGCLLTSAFVAKQSSGAGTGQHTASDAEAITFGRPERERRQSAEQARGNLHPLMRPPAVLVSASPQACLTMARLWPRPSGALKRSRWRFCRRRGRRASADRLSRRLEAVCRPSWDHGVVDEDEKRKAIETALEREVCPNCGEALGRDRVGSGRLADGVFCSLGWQATFHEEYYARRRDWGSPSSN